ncbi:MAG: radical SAM protein [Thermodesulfovibrionales bacterium]|nr:radical SAM protein [Thermodesulfovibrionales bacterium]
MSRRLVNNALRLLALETGTVHKEPGGKVRVCLVYPNEYPIAMSSLGFQGVYAMLNKRSDVFCERAFLPTAQDMAEHERTGVGLFSLESQTPLASFDIIAFSVSFENDFPNVLRVLGLAGIPFRSDARDTEHPLVVLGGVCAFSNPEPLAEFFDVVFVGEAEEMLQEFMDVFLASDAQHHAREDLLGKAKDIEGVYVPAFYELEYAPDGHISQRRAIRGAPERVKRRFVSDIAAQPLVPLIITPEAEFSSMLLAEAMRGCPWNCNFCLAGHVYNPPRIKPGEALCEEVARAASTGLKVGLIGPSLSDYPYREMVLGQEGVSFSITSLRASPKSAELAALLKGHRSISIAPEAGSERLRRAINKKITRQDILETSQRLLEGGLKSLRLYFMLGLPGEEAKDVEAIVELVREVRSASKAGKIALTLSVFVPKPHTPFQWQPMLEASEVRKRIKLVQDGLRGHGGVSVSAESPRLALLQGFLAQGDRRVSQALELMVAGGSWERAAKAAGLDPAWYISREKPLEEPRPWDFIDSGIESEALWKRSEESLSALR